tara:strand:- start:49 stop:348 length:300 start_codon:yes stop_codon:yes gene_type:complete
MLLTLNNNVIASPKTLTNLQRRTHATTDTITVTMREPHVPMKRRMPQTKRQRINIEMRPSMMQLQQHVMPIATILHGASEIDLHSVAQFVYRFGKSGER